MLKILGLSLLALLVLTVIIVMVVVKVRNALVPERPRPPSDDEARGPFTRPTQPADPSTIRYNQSDHVHMRSGTIYEVRNPETEGILPVRPNPLTPPRLRSRDGDSFDTLLQSMNDVSRALHGALSGGGPMAPGVVVRVTQNVETTPSQKEQEALATMRHPNPKKKPETPRKNRYHRDPVI